MSASRKDYNEEEIDAVIDHLDLGFMRNIIKQSDDEVLGLMMTFTGSLIVLRMRTRQLGRTIIDSIKGLWS